MNTARYALEGAGDCQYSAVAFMGITAPVQKSCTELYDGTSWSTRVTAKFGGSNTTVETTDNNCDNWGWNFISTNRLHTGNGNNTGYQSGQNTRITIDFYGWSPSNSSYTTIPMQNIFITSNFSGTENTDYTNLLDYDRNITTAGAINLGHASDTTIARSAAGKVTIEGNEIYHEGHKPTLAELGAQASGNYITGSGSLSAQDLTDIGNLSGTNTGDQDLSGYVATSGDQTITGVKNFTGEIHWDLTAGQYAGDPRAVVFGYSGGNYGQLGYNIDFTSTSGTHNRVFNDIPTRIDLHNGIVVYAADAGSAGTSITWTEVLEAQRDAFQYKGNNIYYVGNDSGIL